MSVFQGVENTMSEDEEEEDEDVIALTAPIPSTSASSSESNRFGSLDKMVALLAILVEKSRSEDDNLIHLSDQDMNALAGGPQSNEAIQR